MSLPDPPVSAEDNEADHDTMSNHFLPSVSLPELPPIVPLDAHPAAVRATAALPSPSVSQPVSSPAAPAPAPFMPTSAGNVDVGVDFAMNTETPVPAPATTARQPPTRRGSRRALSTSANADDNADSTGSKTKSKGKEREVAVEPPSDDNASGGSTATAYGLEAPSSSLRGLTREEALRAFRNSAALASQLQNVTQAVATLSSTSDSRHRDLVNIVNDTNASRAPLDAQAFQSSLTNDTRFRHLYQTVYTQKTDLEGVSRSLLEARRDISQLRSMPREPPPPPPPPLPTPGAAYQYPPLPPMHPLPPVPVAPQQFMAQPGPSSGPVATPQQFIAQPGPSSGPVTTPFNTRPTPGPSAPPSDIRPTPARAPPFDTTATPGPSTSRRNRASGPPAKKARTDTDRSRDVVIWSVSEEEDPWDIAQRIVANVPGFHSGNIYSSFRLDNRSDAISVRFQSRQLAERFVHVLTSASPLGFGLLCASLVDAPAATSTVSSADLAFITGKGGGMRGLRIGTWNLHGNLALKLTQNDVSTLVRNCDIYLFVETWLRPGQHDILTIPNDFHIYSSPRPASSDLRPQRGGVAALVRSSIHVVLRELLCAPNIIGLELPFCLILGVYVPPPGSNWQGWSDTDPEDKLFAYIEMAHQLTTKPLLILGDVNARTGSHQVDLPTTPRRSSSDDVSNARGRRLLEVCRNYSLVILNGTTYEQHTPGAYTSLQPGGSSVVDYALLSQQLLPNL